MNNSNIDFRNSIGRSPVCFGCLLIALVLAFVILSSNARAQDGNYGNGNTAEGADALYTIISGNSGGPPGGGNTAIGFNALFSDTFGTENTAVGDGAMVDNTTGFDNTAMGWAALYTNTTGIENTAIGTAALEFNTSGHHNTAVGAHALDVNSTGAENTATGFNALINNTTGGDNTATGIDALVLNKNGTSNTAGGAFSLYSNTDGSFNTANGLNALRSNGSGSSNAAVGIQALYKNTSGSLNVAVGALAGQNLTTGNNNIDIGANVLGVAGESNKIRIGKQGTQNGAFIAGIFGVPVTGSTVVVNASGKLGVATSSARFKDNIRPMGVTSEAILSLRPVTFRYKQELDPDAIPQFGLVAEEVEKINPDLVVRGEDGKVMTVRYEAVNAMLLNEFLKEHRNVAEQQSTIAELKTTVAQQQKQIEALTTTVRKVGERVELSAPAPQIAANED